MRIMVQYETQNNIPINQQNHTLDLSQRHNHKTWTLS